MRRIEAPPASRGAGRGDERQDRHNRGLSTPRRTNSAPKLMNSVTPQRKTLQDTLALVASAKDRRVDQLRGEGRRKY